MPNPRISESDRLTDDSFCDRMKKRNGVNMKENEFDFDNIIKFKSLADKIQNVSDNELEEDEFDLDEFMDSGVVELFKKMLLHKKTSNSNRKLFRRYSRTLAINQYTKLICMNPGISAPSRKHRKRRRRETP